MAVKKPRKPSPVKYDITTWEIELILANKFDYNQNIIIPNISWGLRIHECDLLVLSKAGYLTEIEIKTSVSDLKADFRKQHGHQHRYIKNFYYAFPCYMEAKAMDLIPPECGVIVIRRMDSRGTYWDNDIADIMREPVPRRDAIKLPDHKVHDFLRLGIMRSWQLREQIKMLRENSKRPYEIAKGLAEVVGMGEDAIKEFTREWDTFVGILGRMKKADESMRFGLSESVYFMGGEPYTWVSKDEERWMRLECFNPS